MANSTAKEYFLAIRDNRVLYRETSARKLADAMQGISNNSHAWYSRNFKRNGNHFLAVFNNEVYGFQKILI